MKIKIHGRFLFIVALSIGLVHCGAPKPPDENSRANELISQNKNNEAIAMLDLQVRANPEDSKARLTLASAYAANAGIFLKNYMGLAQEIVNASRSRDAQIANDANIMIYQKLRQSAKTPEQRKIIDVAQAIFVASARMNTIIRQFGAIPSVNSPQALASLQTAVDLLDGDNYRGGPALYRGLLRLVLVKDYFRANISFNYFSNCKVDFNDLVDHMIQIKAMVARIFNDLILGIMEPGKNAQMKQAAARFDIDMANAIDTIKSVNGPGAMDLSFVYQQLNAKCEGKP